MSIAQTVRSPASQQPQENTPTSITPGRPHWRPTHWRPQQPRQWSQIAAEALPAIGTAIGTSRWPLALLGAVGAGKTFAALCVGDLFATRRYLTTTELCDDLIAAQQDRLNYGGSFNVTAGDFWRRWERADVAILDEIGARLRVSDHHYDAVKKCLDLRERRPLIVCSNLSLQQIAEIYDDRIASRIGAGVVATLRGKDRRLL